MNLHIAHHIAAQVDCLGGDEKLTGRQGTKMARCMMRITALYIMRPWDFSREACASKPFRN